MRLRSLILLGLILHAFPTFAQLDEAYFNDQEGKERGIAKISKRHGTSLIIGGSSFDRYLNQPSIVKVDLDGAIVWTTTTLDTKVYTGATAFIDNLIVSGDFIYATCLVDFDPVEIWKVNATTGAILWKKAFTVDSFSKHMIDYNATSFIISYTVYNGPMDYDRRFAFIDKGTGSTLTSFSMGGPLEQDGYGLAIDGHRDIYYTRNDSIFKVSGTNPKLVLWKTKRLEAAMMEFQHIHIDENGQVFLFGSRNTTSQVGKVLGFNKDTGAFLWEVTVTDIGDDVEFSDMVDDGDNVIVTWKHVYVGGGTYNIWTTKIGKASGNILWKSTHSFESGKTEAALSLDLDNAGDILLSGYHRAANYGPGEWAFVKLNGTTGASIYGETITENAAIPNTLSMGIALHYVDGFAYMVGNMETFHLGYKHSTPAIVKVNTESKEILYKKYLYGNYQFPSRTIAIEEQGDSTFRLRQVGRHAVVGLYKGNNIIWEKSLLQNYALLGSNLIVSPDETITVTGYSVPVDSNPPFYDMFDTDSIHTFTFDFQGALLANNGFGVYSFDSYPVETLKEGNNVFVLYRKNAALHLRKIVNNIVSPEVTLDLRFIPTDITPSGTKTLLPFSASEILVVGYQNGIGPRLIKVNKTTMATTALNIASALLTKINYVEKLDNETLLIGGKRSSGKDGLSRYNLNSSTLAWSKEYIASSEIYKFVFNQDRSAVFSIGVKGNDLAVRKIDTASGNLLWTYDYNHAAAVKDIPTDIDIDLRNNNLIMVGYNELIASPQAANDVFIHTISTAGEYRDLIIKHGDFDGKSKASVVKVVSNGEVYIGGNLNHGNQLDGFVYSMNAGGCEQLLAAQVSQVSDHLIVSDQNAAYQWKNCGTGQDITGAVNKEFTPAQSGNYAVNVSKDGCIKTSECFAFTDCASQLSGVVTQDYDHLVAFDEDADYQWINCATGLDIPGAINKTFWPSASGNYKVRVLKNGCAIISTCFSYSICELVLTPEIAEVDDHLVVSYDDVEYQWFDCVTGLAIPGAINKTFAPRGSGNYKVKVSKDGCSMTSECFSFSVCPSVPDPQVSEVDDHLVVSIDDAQYQWLNCATSLEIPGATNKTFTPEASGSYNVRVSKNDCATTSACTLFEKNITGLPSLRESGLQLFPNPATHHVTIELGKQISMGTISIKGSNGATVFEASIKNKKEIILSTKDLPPGLYFVLINTGSSSLQVKKLLIK